MELVTPSLEQSCQGNQLHKSVEEVATQCINIRLSRFSDVIVFIEMNCCLMFVLRLLVHIINYSLAYVDTYC